MTNRIEFMVPGQCIPKGRPRVGRRITRTPAQTVAYERMVGSHALRARQQVPSGSWPLTGHYRVTVVIVDGDRIRRDGDNQLKSILDACNGVLWDDDHQVMDGRFIRAGVDKDEPRVRVIVERLAAADTRGAA